MLLESQGFVVEILNVNTLDGGDMCIWTGKKEI